MNDAAKTTGPRYALLDELRGLALISMIGYHAMWDLVYMFGLYAPWYGGTPGFLWQQATSWTFILLSGFCLGLGHHPVRRGLIVFGGGALVTLVTLIVIMVAIGYVEAGRGNHALEVALNMRSLVAALYLVSAILQFIGLALIYNLDKKTLERMESELRERREEAAENAEV